MLGSAREDTEERLQWALATGRAAVEPGEVAEAALAGRVGVLFLPDGEPVWGRLENGHARVHAERQEGDIDVLERAAVDTLATGGTVDVRARDDLPDATVPAAVLRW